MPARRPSSSSKPRRRAARLLALRARLPREHGLLHAIGGRSAARSRLSKNPLWARAGGQTVGGALPAGRLTRGVGLVVFLGLTGLSARYFIGQKLDIAGQIERAARTQYIPQLERQLGTKIEVGSFATDWLGRVIVRDIVIGRDARLPLGAVARVQSVTIGLDLVGLALGRMKALDAVNAVTLDKPQISLQRDARGQLNVLRLIRSRPGSPPFQWTGTLWVKDGQLYYVDATLRSVRGIPLEVDARGINGAVRFAGKAPLRYDATISQAILPRENASVRNLVGNGAYNLATKEGIVSTDTPPIAASIATQYVFRKREVVSTAGTISGHLVVGIYGKRIVPRGDVMLNGVAGMVPTAREPLNGVPKAGPVLRLDNVSGPLQFVGTAFETKRLAVRALDADWQVAGAASLGDVKPGKPIQPLFDLTLATQRVPLARLRPWAPRSLPVDYSSRAVRVNAQIAGTDKNVRASGTLEADAARFTSTDARAKATVLVPQLRSVWAAVYTAGAPLRFALRAQLPSAQVDGAIDANGKRESGQVRARDLQLTVRGATLNAPLQITARAASWQVGSPRYGTTAGRDLRLDTFKPADSARWQGAVSIAEATTGNVRRDAISPQFARFVRSSGTVTARATFADVGSPRPRVSADVALSSVAFAPEVIPANLRAQLGDLGSTLQLSALQAQVGLQNGQFVLSSAQATSPFGVLRGSATPTRVGVEVPDFRLPARQINGFLRSQRLATSGDWRGRLKLSAQPGGRNVDAQFALYAPRVALGTSRGDGTLATSQARLETPRIEGSAQVSEKGVWRANATLSLAEAAIRGGRLGSTRLQLPATINGTRLRGAVMTLAATQRGWSAWLSGSRLALPLQGRVITLDAPTLVAQNGPSTYDTGADFAAKFGDIQITRLSARWGNSGQFEGTARLRGGAVQARLLAREVEADALQRLLAVSSRRTARVAGRFNALLQVEPRGNPRFEVQMPRGSVVLAAQSLTLPLSDISARGEVQTTGAGQVRLTEFSGWSEGARLSASGAVGLKAPAGALPTGSGKLQLTGLRLARVPLAPEVKRNGAPDGIVNGEFNWQLGETPQVEGTASLHGTTFGGIAIDKAQGEVFLARDAEGVRVRLERWNGTIEDAAFKADLEADTRQNFWRLRFNTPQIAARRLTRIQARTMRPGVADSITGALPVEGDIFADIDINGNLGPLAGQDDPIREVLHPFWVPVEGFAQVKAPSLRWRGRALGALKADLSFEGYFARIRTLELEPVTPPDAPATSPRIVLAGKVPLMPNQPGLDATLQIGEAPLEWFFDGIRDARTSLQSNGVGLEVLDRVVNSLDALPDGVRGRVALDATFAGRWSAPTIAVPRLTLRDGRAPLPQGGFSPPATLDTSFAVAGGALTLGTTQLRLEKTLAERENEEDDDPALLTIASGGNIDPKGDVNLQADVVNANLSQLATWLPGLKNSTGAPTLRGNLSGFSVSVSGKTTDPTVVGSIQGENLTYNKYSVDRLLISRFEIGGGQAQIAPGNFVIAKGAFQSSAAWGRIGWDWSKRGVVPEAPVELHFPLQTRDFGALSGVFIPTLSDVNAKEFGGSFDVGGTLANPVFTGQVRVQDGQFRYVSPRAPFPVGITELNGTLRFEDNNRLVIDADDPLRGRLVGAATVAAKRTGDAKRTKASTTKQNPTNQSPASIATAEAAKNISANPSAQLAGKWKLGGSVVLSDLTPATFANPARAIARQKFDLSLSLDEGSYTASDFAGVRDVALGARWQTNEAGDQRLRWMLAARGTRDAKKGKNVGQAFGIGAIKLAPNFATGLDALLSSDAEEFTSTDDFKEFPVSSRFALTALPDRRTQIFLQNFGWSVTGAGNGEVAGRLVLDEREAIQQAPKAAALLQKTSLESKGKAPSLRDRLELDRSRPISFFGRWDETQASTGNRFSQFAPGENQSDELLEEEGDRPIRNLGTLRIGGNLTLQNAEIYGAPSGGGGAVTRLSFLPPAPRFDVKLNLGRNVQFITSALRSQLVGELVASGTPNNPQILGTVETREGQVRFPNARARIEEGRLVVLVSRDAVTDLLRTRVEVDVTARGDAGVSQTISTNGNANGARPQYQRYQITLRLRGPIIFGDEGTQQLQNLSIDVTSNPPLSQGEALGQLLGISVTGGNASGGFDLGDANQTYARAVLQVVSAPLFSGVERSVAQALGLDNVGFEYRFNEPLAVHLSKALGDRVYVTYRRSVGNDNSNGGVRTPFELRIDYRLKGNLLIGLRTTEQQITSLSLLKSWRF